MDSQKENYSDSLGTTSTFLIRNTFWLFVAACISGCTQETWITLPDHSNPYLTSQNSSGPNKHYQKPVIPDRYNLEKLDQILRTKKERPDDEFSADDGRTLTRKQILESGNQ